MKKITVGINGLGRIGRAFLKIAFTRADIKDTIQIVAANDLGDKENLAYLLKYDTAYGRSGLDVSTDADGLVINGEKIAILQEKDPSLLPWGKLGVDVVVESTGFFESYDKASLHINAGAKRVVISAPAKEGGGGEVATVLMGINEFALKDRAVSSNGSCTTNSASPVIQIMNETLGVEKAILSTVHAYTATQKLVDGPDARDWRRGRAAAQNIVPATTGAAVAVTKVIPELEGLFDGISLRVPVVTGSIADVTFISKRDTTVEEVNEILKKAAKEDRWKNIFTTSEEQLVSSDIIGLPYASIADLPFTKVVGGNLVKILAWYDNETGYTHTLADHVIKAAQSI